MSAAGGENSMVTRAFLAWSRQDSIHRYQEELLKRQHELLKDSEEKKSERSGGGFANSMSNSNAAVI